MSKSQVQQSLEMIITIKFDNISMFLLQVKEDCDKEKWRADKLELRLTILKKGNEDGSFKNFQFYQYLKNLLY